MASEFLDIPNSEQNSDDVLKISGLEDHITIRLNKNKTKIKTIKPIPAFCMKVKLDDNSKIFINVCTCPEIPEPVDITEEELSRLLKCSVPSSYRVPISIGEPHQETDKSGNICFCYDVVANGLFLAKIRRSELFHKFFLSLCYESIQDKYGLEFRSDFCIILKNKAYQGTMPNHFIRDKPLIAELCRKETDSLDPVTNTRTPKYVLRGKPITGQPLHMIFEAYLPKVTTADSITVSVGEDRLVLYERTRKYSANIFLPYTITQRSCAADFDICDKVLTIVLPIVPDILEVTNGVE